VVVAALANWIKRARRTIGAVEVEPDTTARNSTCAIDIIIGLEELLKLFTKTAGSEMAPLFLRPHIVVSA
jgi:hypothetical protein